MLFVVVFHISEILSEPLVVQGIDHQYICFFYTVCQQHNAPPSPVQYSTRNSFHRNDPFLLKLPFPIREVVKEQEWIMVVIVRKCAHLYSYLFFICIWVELVFVEIEELDAAFVRKCLGRQGVGVLRKIS